MSTDKLTPPLMALNIGGVVTWAVSVQAILGAIGALLAVITGLMVACINWDKFINSKPVLALRRMLKRK